MQLLCCGQTVTVRDSLTLGHLGRSARSLRRGTSCPFMHVAPSHLPRKRPGHLGTRLVLIGQGFLSFFMPNFDSLEIGVRLR